MSNPNELKRDLRKTDHPPKERRPLIDWDAVHRLDELADQARSPEELEELLEREGYVRLD